MSATKDPLDKMLFKTLEAATKFAEENGFDAVLKLADPQYADKPFVCVKRVTKEEAEEIKKRNENAIIASVDSDGVPEGSNSTN